VKECRSAKALSIWQIYVNHERFAMHVIPKQHEPLTCMCLESLSSMHSSYHDWVHLEDREIYQT